MRFEISERIATQCAAQDLFAALEEQFRKVSRQVSVDTGRLKAVSIEATFGSINRKDETIVSIKPLEGGYLLVADVWYRPSVAFWIILLLTLFSWVGWMIPLGFYLWQKKTVSQAIRSCFERVRNEFAQESASAPRQDAQAASLERFADLKARGLISEEDYEAKKRSILGTNAWNQPTHGMAVADVRVPATSAAPPLNGIHAASTTKAAASFSHELPPGVKGWSWGGFFLNCIWAIPNKTWIGLLALVPVIGLPIPFVLGFKGREWAWRNRSWDSVEQFVQVQRRWTIAGLIVYGVVLAGLLTTTLYPKLHSSLGWPGSSTVSEEDSVDENFRFHMDKADEAARGSTEAASAAMSAAISAAVSTVPPTASASGVSSVGTGAEPAVDAPVVAGRIFEQESDALSIQTVAGLLSTSGDGPPDQRILLNGRALFGGDDAAYQHLVRLFKLSDQKQAVLVQSSGGRGTSCETLLFFLLLEAGKKDVRWTPEFGTCVHDGTFEQHGDRIDLTIPKVGGQSHFSLLNGQVSEDGKPVVHTAQDDLDPAH